MGYTRPPTAQSTKHLLETMDGTYTTYLVKNHHPENDGGSRHTPLRLQEVPPNDDSESREEQREEFEGVFYTRSESQANTTRRLFHEYQLPSIPFPPHHNHHHNHHNHHHRRSSSNQNTTDNTHSNNFENDESGVDVGNALSQLTQLGNTLIERAHLHTQRDDEGGEGNRISSIALQLVLDRIQRARRLLLSQQVQQSQLQQQSQQISQQQQGQFQRDIRGFRQLQRGREERDDEDVDVDSDDHQDNDENMDVRDTRRPR